MYARLLPYCWVVDESGVRSALVISEISRYAGMLVGRTHDGREVARPIVDFESVSHDGIEWHPMPKLRHLIPWEDDDVPGHLLHLPD